MSIILINPPSNSCRAPEEHLGLAYLKSFLAGYKFFVDVIDGYLFKYTTDEIVKKVIKSKDCFLVGLSPFIDSLEQAIEISQKIKKARPEIYICWGGHLATFSDEDLLEKYSAIDFVVRGEGEFTFLELVQSLKNKETEKLPAIKGLAFKYQNKIKINNSRDLIADLDVLPFPDRANSRAAYQTGAVIEISGSRGCYGNCSFCSINSLYKLGNGKSWRGRSAKNIVDELDQLVKKYNFKVFKFVDDSFFGPDAGWDKRALQIAEEIIKRKLKIRFRISTRANNVKKDVFIKLKKAGLYSVSVGIEAATQKSLNIYKKGATVSQNESALKILKDLKIITLAGFIGFNPYTTLEEIEANYRFLNKYVFCLFDVISKPLFVHADDEITKTLLKEGRITGRIFPNYTYEIEDAAARQVHRSLLLWNSFNGRLYNKITDPLSAPRITKPKDEKKLMALYQKMRKIDLAVFKIIIVMIKRGCLADDFFTAVIKLKNKYNPVWRKLEEKLNKLQTT